MSLQAAFADVVAQHRKIVTELIDRLPYEAVSGSNKDWTHAAMRVMHDLCQQYIGPCRKHFYGVHRCEIENHQEWLLDVLWWFQSDTEQGVLLGLESEWADSTGEVCSDFSKVLAVKAPIKIILYYEGTRKRPARSQSRIEGLTSLCRQWRQHSAGDVLYAINFHEGEHETYWHSIARDGAAPDFAFGKIPELTDRDHLPKA